jgi:voltage-gated potassium channel
VTTLTTTGYGDAVPVTLAGRLLGGAVMICGIGLFGLWAGILASGFSQELRRSEFLRTWDLVAHMPLFHSLGAPLIADVTRLLRTQVVSRGRVVVRRGQPGDSMFFIADGEVEVFADPAPVTLTAGSFFGEMALITGEPRNATVVTTRTSMLLRLDVADFRDLMARSPELMRVIQSESARRASRAIAPQPPAA